MNSHRSKRTIVAPREKCKIAIYNDGIRLTAPCVGNPKGKGGGKRSAITGWSKASRRRMREFMLSNQMPGDFTVCACTYTIPGHNLPLHETKRLWHIFQTYARRLGVCAVWRVEIQKRGQLHWHAIAGAQGESKDVVALLTELWHRTLRAMGDINGKNLMDWKGAKKNSADVQPYKDGSAAWKRYLHDHTTKSKQEQVPENIGRHWGVIGKKMFSDVGPEQSIDLDWKVYCKVVRSYNRLCTPYVRHDGAMFNKRRGYTTKRGKIGSSVYFCRPDTMSRLIDWALT